MRNFLLGILLFSGLLSAQTFNIQGLSPDKQASLSQALAQIKDSTAWQEAIMRWQEKEIEKGHAELDLLKSNFAQSIIQFHQGPIYVVNSLAVDSLEGLHIRRSGLERYQQQRLPYHWPSIENGFLDIIQTFQDRGFPLAYFEQKSLAYKPKGKDSIIADLSYAFHRGPRIMIDSVIIEGDHREADVFVQSLTRVAPGEVFNQKYINDIPRILNNSIYYKEVEAPKVQFTPWNTARVYLNLKRKPAGKFDVLLGFLPPEDETQKLRVIGSADILLVSPFRFGETIRFNYNQLTAGSQRLDIETTFPFILRTPLRLDGKLYLFKQQESFLNRSFEGAASYVFSPNLYARFFVKNNRSSLIDVSNIDIDTLTQLGGQYDVVGAGWHYEKLDYRLNPGRGLVVDARGGLGTRKLRRNPRLPESVYEGKEEKQNIREFELQLKSYFSLHPRHIIHLANHTYWLDQDEYFTNDLRQIGGARSLRGFNENQFFTNFYSIFTAEYRLKLERDSYLFLFGDYAYAENRVNNDFFRPSGFGIGMNYGTKAGIISISYAIGSQGDDQLSPGRGKIHIGLNNQF